MPREEVRLNRQLAADIYLRVRGVAPTETGIELTDDDDPRAVEFVVEMRRYDERGTLAAALAAGNVEEDTVLAVGRRLAEFHRDAERITVRAPLLEVQHRRERNLAELLESIDGPVRVADCVEFDADLRGSGVSDDLAFLVSDWPPAAGSVGVGFWSAPTAKPGEIRATTR